MTDDDATTDELAGADPEATWPADRLIHSPAELLLAFRADTFKDVFDSLESDLDTDLWGRLVDDEHVVLMHLSLDFPFTRGQLFEVAETEDTYAEAPYRAGALLEAVENVEGLVCWLDLDEYRSGLGPESSWIPSYRWKRAAPGEWTVAEYTRKRLDVGDDVPLTLADPLGRPAPATTTLDALRASLQEYEIPHYSDRLCAPEALDPSDVINDHDDSAGSDADTEPDQQDLRHEAAELLAGRIVGLLGTGDRFTLDVGHAFVQAVDLIGEDGPAFRLELISNSYLPDRKRLSLRNEQQLRDLGFNDPGDHCANWWIESGIEEGYGRTEEELLEHIHECARAAVDGLVDGYGFSARYVAINWGVRVAALPPLPPFVPDVDLLGFITDVDELREDYASYAHQRRTHPIASPWEADVPAMFVAVVDSLKPGVVFDMIALAPTSGIDQEPGWWRFTGGGWTPDPDATHRVGWGIVARPIDAATARTLEKDMRF